MSNSNEKTIWNTLSKAIGNDYGVAGVMGNLFAESALNPKNLQNSYESKLGYTDTTYTNAVDKGTYTKFATDSAGYGLAQWTFSTRKKNLLAYAQEKGKSIGNLEMQLDFLIQEMKSGYSGVWKTVCNATTVKEASDIVLTGFERPADQSTTVKNKRASYGQTYYDKYAAATAPAYVTGKTYTLQVELNVRSGAGTSCAKVGYDALTADGKKHDSDKDGALDKGTKVTCKQIKKVGNDVWMRIPSGWVAAFYNGKIYVS